MAVTLSSVICMDLLGLKVEASFIEFSPYM